MAFPDGLNDIPLFRGLSARQLARLDCHLRHVVIPAGKTIITATQADEDVYILRNGTVKVHVEQVDGTDVILAILGPGQIMGEVHAADNLGHSASVITLEESTFLWMNRSDFCTCLETIPELQQNLLHLLCGRLRLANAQIQSLVSLDAAGRVARQIIIFAQEYGHIAANGDIHIPLRLTQHDLASMVGASRVRVNQILADYRQRGYLTITPQNRMVLRDPQNLARCAHMDIPPTFQDISQDISRDVRIIGGK